MQYLLQDFIIIFHSLNIPKSRNIHTSDQSLRMFYDLGTPVSLCTQKYSPSPICHCDIGALLIREHCLWRCIVKDQDPYQHRRVCKELRYDQWIDIKQPFYRCKRLLLKIDKTNFRERMNLLNK